MNDISDSYKQVNYPSEPTGTYNIPIGSSSNAQVCRATSLQRRTELQRGSGSLRASWEVAPDFHPSDISEICF